MIGHKLAHYELTGHLGSGGMGNVWRARDTKLGREVAIKTLPEEFARDADRLARFEREARLLATLNHPNIAAIHGLEEHKGARFLVLELVEHETLADRLRHGPVPLEESLKLARQIAEAMEAAHERGVVHRDLKPANIKVTPAGVVKVLDFGLAKPASSARADDAVTGSIGATEAGVILGTVAYMAPEQASGKHVDKRTDIWAFGVVLYELLTGEQPFSGADAHEMLVNIFTRQPDLQRIPSKARRLVAKCLEKDQRHRLRDLGDASVLLDGAELPASASSAPFRLNPVLAVVAGVLLVALAAVSFLYFRRAPEPEHVLRYNLALPEDARSIHSFAISPDGRTVAIAAVVNGKRQLWLHAMDALQPEPLPFTEDATYPFWSPDSSSIGFFAQGSLKKIAATGGPAESICSVPDARGGSWNRDNVIVFASSLGGHAVIQRVPASGGTPVDVTAAEGDNVHPTFLPDGRHFLSVNRAGEERGIYVNSLDGKERRRLLLDVSGLAYAAPSRSADRVGHVLFIRGNSLMAQPFKADSAQLLSEAFPIAQGVSLTTNDTYAPVTESETGVVLYESAASESSSHHLYWYDRDGKIQGEIGAPGDSVPSISPDGKMAAFAREQDSGQTIWLRDLNRGTDQILTSSQGTYGAPTWSPSGDRIAFGSRKNGIFDLYQRTLGLSAQDELLLNSPNSKAPTQWSNGFLVYQEFNPRTKRDIWVLPMESGVPGKPKVFLQTPYDELLGRLSPDGRWMAYTSDISGRLEVWVRAFPSADHETLVSTAGGQQPHWSGDGKELFFEAGDGKMTVVAASASGNSFSAGPPQPLFDMNMARTENGAQFQYDVTADGKRFLIAAAASSARHLTVVVNWRAGISVR